MPSASTFDPALRWFLIAVKFFFDPDFVATIRQKRAWLDARVRFPPGPQRTRALRPRSSRATRWTRSSSGPGGDLSSGRSRCLLGVAGVTAICQFGMRFILIGTSRDVELRLRENLFKHLTSLSWPFFNRSRTGDLMSRLTSDVESVRMGVGPGVMYVLDTGLRTIGAVCFMCTISPLLTVAAVVPMVAIFLFLRPHPRQDPRPLARGPGGAGDAREPRAGIVLGRAGRSRRSAARREEEERFRELSQPLGRPERRPRQGSRAPDGPDRGRRRPLAGRDPPPRRLEGHRRNAHGRRVRDVHRVPAAPRSGR